MNDLNVLNCVVFKSSLNHEVNKKWMNKEFMKGPIDFYIKYLNSNKIISPKKVNKNRL